jgi:hypothetical protein
MPFFLFAICSNSALAGRTLKIPKVISGAYQADRAARWTATSTVYFTSPIGFSSGLEVFLSNLSNLSQTVTLTVSAELTHGMSPYVPANFTGSWVAVGGGRSNTSTFTNVVRTVTIPANSDRTLTVNIHCNWTLTGPGCAVDNPSVASITEEIGTVDANISFVASIYVAEDRGAILATLVAKSRLWGGYAVQNTDNFLPINGGRPF